MSVTLRHLDGAVSQKVPNLNQRHSSLNQSSRARMSKIVDRKIFDACATTSGTKTPFDGLNSVTLRITKHPRRLWAVFRSKVPPLQDGRISFIV
jgi:hypothetical protein